MCGEAVIASKVLDGMIASAVDVAGGRLPDFEDGLESARRTALVLLAKRAKTLGANAVVGIRLDYETLRGGSLMVCTSGTAVVAAAEDQPVSATVL